MAVVTFTLFAFDTLPGRLWAFSQMGLAKPALRRTPGLAFFKLMGTGSGDGFSTWPNFGIYTLLCEWPSLEVAQDAVEDAPIFGRYRSHASRMATLFLDPVTARGSWAGHEFACPQLAARQAMPVIAMTRASIRPSKLFRFWPRVPGISDAVLDEPTRHFMIGTGEAPWLNQVTFSVWNDLEAMRDFSLKSPSHGEAVRRAYSENWFSEYCFVRFNLLGQDGEWPGLDLPGIRNSRSAPAPGLQEETT